MSSVGWIILCLLVILPVYYGEEITEKLPQRNRRSLMNLNAMVKAVVGRDGSEFIGYGNWCGLGGSGPPVDEVDECCQVHDICYDLARDGPCKKQGEKAVYQVEYKWKKTDDGQAYCSLEEDKCIASVCMCDAMITNCLKKNVQFYNEENVHKLNIFEIIREADWLTS